MKRNWIEIKEEIEHEIDAIWIDEPVEVKASSRGLFPSEAGSHGMASGNLVFQIADTYAAGFGSAAKGIEWILEDENFTLDHAKALFPALYSELAMHMGGQAKNGAAWLNMPKVWKIYQDIIDSMEEIDNKKDFSSLLWSLKNYIKRLNMWFCLTFTWEVMGNLRCSKQVADYEKLMELTLRTEPYMKNAVESRI